MDQGDVEALKTVCQDVTSAGKKIEDLIYTKNNETLLHRALKQEEVNLDIVKLLTERACNGYISIFQQVCDPKWYDLSDYET